jgi:putative ABC transport system permease protein
MVRNYFKIAIRNLFHHKVLSGINILGLAAGISCCLLIALYVYNETSYDRFHKNANRIFRVTMEYSFDGVINKTSVTGNKLFPAFKRNFPEVENGVRMFNPGAIVKYDTKLFEENAFVFADSTVFDIFSFKLLQGNPHTVLENPNTVVVTESTAKKYFGNDEPIGKLLRVNNEKDYKVTGVVQDCPSNSQIKFDFLASFSSLDGPIYKTEKWWNANYFTYLLLKTPEADKSLSAKIPSYMKTQDKENGITGNNYLTFHLEPLRKVHLYSQVEGGFEPAGDYRYVYIFSAIALLILCIACANYMNLITARAAERAKEVGIRKVMGAVRKQLFGQFMGESLITVCIALLVSLGFVKLLLPLFNFVSAKQLNFSTIFQPATLSSLLIVLILVGLIGGSYPALVLSAYKPIKVLKGNFKTRSSGGLLRKILIVTQFVISVGLIVCTIVIHNQLAFIQNKKLGYDKDHVIILPVDKFIRQKIGTFKTEFKSDPNVISVATCTQTPTFIPGKYNLKVNDRDMIVTAEGVDKDFIKTLGLKIAAGSDFTDADETSALSEDENTRGAVVLNESAAKSLDWNAEEAVGKTVQFQGRNSIVKAVVKDFHFASMHEPISPIVLFLNGYTRTLLVKLSGAQLPQTLQFLKRKWNELAPHRPFEYKFLDEEYNKLYTAETRTGKIFYAFALLAIGLACLGLFGLATFTARQRTKEIGIRKVLGASVPGIITLLSRDFLKLVIISTLIAFPIAWWAMNKWLQDFVYRINIGWWVFALAAVLAFLIAFITISFQAIKAAVSNPVKSLRTE